MLSLFLVGCAPTPVEAPREVTELATWMFAEFDGELAPGVEELDTWLVDMPLDGDLEDRVIAMPVLSELGGISGPVGEDPADQLPVAVAGLSRHDIDTHFGLVAEDNLVCIESNTTTYYRREHLSDPDCLGSDCDRVDTENEVHKESVIASVWFDLFKDHRALTLSDGRQAMVARSWIEQSYEADREGYSWDQFYTLEVWIEEGSETRRFHTVWSAVHLGPVGPDLYTTTVYKAIDEGFTNSDDFVDGELCGNDRDQLYER
ncbi:MAG TPA: hypothetical protein QGF58_25245 [Myxococcota bacterium]|nr:hypothetical protein [Myxococcota bacterium]